MRKQILCLIAGLFLSAGVSAQQHFTLPPLPYDAGALEPHIDRATMERHHGGHHQGYIDKLNEQIRTYPQLRTMPFPTVLAAISEFNTEVRNNAGGHYNHQLFWTLMAPAGSGGQPSEELRQAVNEVFGSIEQAQRQFEEAAASVFGSGWVWLSVADNGRLQITTTQNQDNPLMDVVDQRGKPILALDVWEHSYYLRYQNRREEYVRAWWNVVNWNEVNRLFAEAKRS
jgi:superoxide dismutase, Fe-Mn family